MDDYWSYKRDIEDTKQEFLELLEGVGLKKIMNEACEDLLIKGEAITRLDNDGNIISIRG